MTKSNREAFESVVRTRRSVRGFLAKEVDAQTLEKVFELAQTAPSNCNTQPWHVHVASGKVAAEIKERLTASMAQGETDMDFPYSGKYDGQYKVRQYDAAAQLYTAMGVTREDKDGRQAAFIRNFSFFDAPHAAFLFIPEEFGMREAADLGMYAQNLMLSLTAYGIASCPQTALGFNCGLVREILGVPANMRLLFGIAFGYEDESVAANNARVGRAGLADAVKFHG